MSYFYIESNREGGYQKRLMTLRKQIKDLPANRFR